MPESLLLRILQSSYAAGQENAFEELDRRDRVGTLSPAAFQRLIAICLAEQASMRTGPLTIRLMDALDYFHIFGRLTEDQKKQFARQSVRQTLEIRPRVLLGDRVPFRVNVIPRVQFPFDVTAKDLDLDSIYVDGRKTAGSIEQNNAMCLGLEDNMTMGEVACGSVGIHRLSIRPREVQVHPGLGALGNIDYFPPDDIGLVTGTFEVVARLPAGDFTLVDNPALAPALRACIRVEFCHVARLNPMGNYEVHLYLVVQPVPANVGFDVIARFGADEYNLGTMSFTKDTGAYLPIRSSALHLGTNIPPSKFDLILRSDEKVGRETFNEHEIWRGELIYPNLPVEILQQPATQF
jgi:hypothetical protein